MSVTGGFGEEVVKKSVTQNSFVRGKIRDLVISRRVEYRSPTTGMKHTGELEYVEKKNLSSVGVNPGVFLRVFVEPINEVVLVEMDPEDVVKFGEFSSLNGRFKLTVSEVEVKVDSESVEFDGFGEFKRAGEVKDTMTYLDWRNMRESRFNDGYRCGKVIEEKLREEWARNEGFFSGIWTVKDFSDSKFSSTATLEVECTEVDETLSFSLSTEDWEENEKVRNIIEEDGMGIPSNLEGEEVFVSLGDYSTPVAESGSWKLYRKSDRPNILFRLWEKMVT